MLRKMLGGVTAVLMMSLIAACGEDVIEPDPAVTPFVGTWDADSLTLTSDAVPPDTVNLLISGSFVITVEPSGQYTATLTVIGQASPEIGQLSILNSATLTLTPTFPAGRPVATSAYIFPSDDYLILDGPTEFDFNLDGTAEPAQAHFELRRQ